MPAARHFSRAPGPASAVMAMIGVRVVTSRRRISLVAE